ncbi:MAG: hypothetical protein ACLUTA_13130 [Blautia wexlerae]
MQQASFRFRHLPFYLRMPNITESGSDRYIVSRDLQLSILQRFRLVSVMAGENDFLHFARVMVCGDGHIINAMRQRDPYWLAGAIITVLLSSRRYITPLAWKSVKGIHQAVRSKSNLSTMKLIIKLVAFSGHQYEHPWQRFFSAHHECTALMQQCCLLLTK